jgi:hypothetical protein
MSHRLQLLVSQELNCRIRKAAQRNRLSMGEWVRRAIEQALRRQGGKGAPRGDDPLERLAALNGPTCDIDQMIREIEAGRS